MSRGAAGLLLAANVFFFWPVLFHGRVFSSAESSQVAAPWSGSSAGSPPANPLLADAASAALPTLRRIRRFPEGFLWNRFVASGIPGAINIVQGYLSPFAWVPAALLPAAAIETGILFLKLNCGFLFFYAFARSQGLTGTASACGAAAWGWSTAISVWWLWMQSSTVIAVPLLLLAAAKARTLAGAPRAVLLAAGGSFLLLTGGYPHMILFAGVALALFVAFDRGPSPDRSLRIGLLRLSGGAALALGLLLPAVLVSTRFLRETGAVGARRGLSASFHLPLSQLALYANPLARGDTLADDYRPVGASRDDNYMETATGVGPAALLLALAGAWSRRRRLFAYAATMALAVFVLVYVPGPLQTAADSVPLLSAGLLERSKVLIVLAIAIAAALGAECLERAARRGASLRAVRIALPALVGIPLLSVAARFYPAVSPSEAVFRKTPGIEKLARLLSGTGGRFFGTGWTIYPDLSEAFGLEDIRGHLFFARDYRRLLQAADPNVGRSTGSLLIFDPAVLRAQSPALDLLGVRAIATPPETRLSLPVLYSGPDLTIYGRPSALPRFFLAGSVLPGGIEEVRRAPRALLATTAFVQPREIGRLSRRLSADGAAKGRISVESLRAESFRVRIETATPSLLASSQKLFPPYWRARIDGSSATPIRVDGLFLGVPIPAGRHVVEGRFRIPLIERLVSLLSAAVLAALALAALRQPRLRVS